MKDKIVSMEEMAEFLGMELEEFVALLLEAGLIDDRGRPTEYAL